MAALLLSAVLSLSVSAASAAQKSDRQVIVYNWSEYIPQDVLTDFTRETGIKVIYSTFESNEAMFHKVKLLQGKAYDIVVPSGYFVDRMRKEKLLSTIDKSKLPNLVHLDPKIMGQEYDPENQYSIPYMWGAAGIAYNSKSLTPGSITRWADLLKPELKGKIILTDDLRDAFGLALRARGFSINSTNPEEIRQAYEFLAELKSSVRVFDVTATKQALITKEVLAGTIWNGDYLVAKEENPDLEFVFPQEGAVLWVDSFVIPSGAVNVENAHIFINYMLRPEVAAKCVEEFKYSTPNRDALELLPEELRNNPVLVPGEKELMNAEFTTGVGESITLYEKYWEQMKTLR